MNKEKLDQIAKSIKDKNPEMSDEECGQMAKEIVIGLLESLKGFEWQS